MRPTDVDRAEATQVVSAVQRGDTESFNAAFSGAVARYGGLARLVWAVAEHTEEP